MTNPKPQDKPEAKTALAASAGSAAPVPVCEWCGNPMVSLRGKRDLEDGQIQALGRCTICCADVWSKPIDKPQEQVTPNR